MGFAVEGRYILVPVEPADAQKYVDLQLDCLAETYNELVDAGFGERQRAERDSWLKEFDQNITAPKVRAFFAYENPAWQPGAPLSCAMGGAVDWEQPVGFALSRPGPLEWERRTGLPLVPEGTRELTHLYTRASTHGTGLGAALFDAVLYEDEPAYLWYIKGNERAVQFYEHRGFTRDGRFVDCQGAWGDAATGRMFRGVKPPA